jgi:hypothetical protein
LSQLRVDVGPLGDEEGGVLGPAARRGPVPVPGEPPRRQLLPR